MKTYKHILCATDFSSFCDQACIEAGKLARKSEAKLTLLHVVDHFAVDRSNEEIAPEDVDPKVFREQRARAKLKAQIERTGILDAETEVAFSTDAAAHEIVHYAGIHGIDLIVVASHGNKGITEFLGSTAKTTQLHASCEVLVVPAKGQ